METEVNEIRVRIPLEVEAEGPEARLKFLADIARGTIDAKEHPSKLHPSELAEIEAERTERKAKAAEKAAKEAAAQAAANAVPSTRPE